MSLTNWVDVNLCTKEGSRRVCLQAKILVYEIRNVGLFLHRETALNIRWSRNLSHSAAQLLANPKSISDEPRSHHTADICLGQN